MGTGRTPKLCSSLCIWLFSPWGTCASTSVSCHCVSVIKFRVPNCPTRPVEFCSSSWRALLTFACCFSADSLLRWKSEGKVAVWLRVPISLSRCTAAASTHGFAFHHAKDDYAVLALWLGEGESRLPGFATHQVGVAGTDLSRWKPTVEMGVCCELHSTISSPDGTMSCTVHFLIDLIGG